MNFIKNIRNCVTILKSFLQIYKLSEEFQISINFIKYKDNFLTNKQNK